MLLFAAIHVICTCFVCEPWLTVDNCGQCRPQHCVRRPETAVRVTIWLVNWKRINKLQVKHRLSASLSLFLVLSVFLLPLFLLSLCAYIGMQWEEAISFCCILLDVTCLHSDSIQYYGMCGRLNHAIRLSMEHGLERQLLAYALATKHAHLKLMAAK